MGLRLAEGIESPDLPIGRVKQSGPRWMAAFWPNALPKAIW